MSRFATDAAVLCRRAPNAQAIVFAGETVYGPVDIEDRQEADASGNLYLVRRTVARIATADLSTLADGDSVTIGGTSYVVREVMVVNDGLIKELVCAEVTS